MFDSYCYFWAMHLAGGKNPSLSQSLDGVLWDFLYNGMWLEKKPYLNHIYMQNGNKNGKVGQITLEKEGVWWYIADINKPKHSTAVQNFKGFVILFIGSIQIVFLNFTKLTNFTQHHKHTQKRQVVMVRG